MYSQHKMAPTLAKLYEALTSGFFYIMTTVTLAAIPVLAKMSQGAEGRYEYSSFVMVMCTEVGKLVISVVQYMKLVREKPNSVYKPSMTEFAWIFVPSIIYALNNNLQMLVMTVMDPSTFQVLSNFKIVTTAVLWRLVMGQTLLTHQWLAVYFMTMGSLSLSAPSGGDAGSQGAGTTFVGLLLIAVQCTMSALGSITTEYAFKKKGTNVLPAQNIMMYSQGILLNLVFALVSRGSDSQPVDGSVTTGGLFAGFTAVVWLLVLTRSVVGVMISMIFKYASSILYTLVAASAAPVAAILSFLFFGTTLSMQYMASSVVVLLAVYQYNAHKIHDDMAPKTTSSTSSSSSSSSSVPQAAREASVLPQKMPSHAAATSMPS